MNTNRPDRYWYGLVVMFAAWVVICGILVSWTVDWQVQDFAAMAGCIAIALDVNSAINALYLGAGAAVLLDKAK
jgi:hypothetical protein